MWPLRRWKKPEKPQPIPPCPCPYCGTKLDSGVLVNRPEKRILAGCRSLCYRCLGWCVYTPELALRRLTEAEIFAMAVDHLEMMDHVERLARESHRRYGVPPFRPMEAKS